MREDIVVVGDGPAGLAVATACAEVGLTVTVLAPDPGRRWVNTLGVWVDELDGLRLDGVLARIFPAPLIATDVTGTRALPRPYGLIDNEALQSTLRDRLRANGGEERRGTARSVTVSRDGWLVHCSEGATVPAGLVMDATGHRAVLVQGGVGPPPARQVAYGIVARLRSSPVPPGGMWFMDWRTVPGGGPAVSPTFLYAMDLGEGWTLCEETALAVRGALDITMLRHRLEARLSAHGAQVLERAAPEHVVFPMGQPLPPRDQGVVAYGAAAGMVHPATGFQVGSALRRAPEVAAAVADAMTRHPTDLQARAVLVWDAVWPADLRRQRDLHIYGLELLLSFDSRDIQRFFTTFFSLPTGRWRAYVSGASSSRELAGVMLDLVRRLPPRLGWAAMRGALSRRGVSLIRALRRAGGSP